MNTLAGCVSPVKWLSCKEPPELVKIHAIEQSKDIVFDEKANTM